MVVDGFGQFVAAGADVGRRRAADDRAGADDRDLDDQVVEDAGLRLEDASGSGRGFRSGRCRSCRRRGSCRRRPRPRSRSGSGPARDRRSAAIRSRHSSTSESMPERQEVDLDEAGVVAGVLVPLAEVAALHGGRLDRHQAGERLGGDDHAAGVLGDVAGEAGELLGQVDQVATRAGRPCGRRRRGSAPAPGRASWPIPAR